MNHICLATANLSAEFRPINEARIMWQVCTYHQDCNDDVNIKIKKIDIHYYDFAIAMH